MGTWGTKIYEDDTALDIRGYFLTGLDAQQDVGELESEIKEEYLEDDSQDYNENIILALACVELESGTLTAEIKEQALKVIESDRQYRFWMNEAGKEDAALRKRELTLIKKYLTNYDNKPVKRRSWLEMQKADKEFAEAEQKKAANRKALGDKLERKNQLYSDTSETQSWILTSVETLALLTLGSVFIKNINVGAGDLQSLLTYGRDHLGYLLALGWSLLTLLRMPPGSAVGIFKPLLLLSASLSGLIAFASLQSKTGLFWDDSLSLIAQLATLTQVLFFGAGCLLIAYVAVNGLLRALRNRSAGGSS